MAIADMPVQAEAMTTPGTVNGVCRLPMYASVGNVEDAITAFFIQHGPVVPAVELDGSDCQYVDIASLIVLSALIAQRSRSGLSTSLRLPRSRDVRDIMRLWEFPRAIKHATGTAFSEIVHPDDLHFFGEAHGLTRTDKRQTPKYERYIASPLGDGVERVLSNQFFAITTFQIDQSRSRTRMVLQESERWETRLIRSVLAKHLKGPSEYFSSRIVFESMMNAARHPVATLIQSASRFVPRKQGDRYIPHHFTILYWDDGQSMVDTLGAAISEGKPVRSVDVPALYADYLLRIEDEGGEIERKVISSGTTPDANTPIEELLLATTFPGITRDTAGKEHIVHPQLQEQSPIESFPGMGLHVLVNAAVDVFGGSVAFRTKNLFMNIKQTDDSDSTAKYSAKVRRFDSKRPEFLGNLIVIRLPLSGQAE